MKQHLRGIVIAAGLTLGACSDDSGTAADASSTREDAGGSLDAAMPAPDSGVAPGGCDPSFGAGGSGCGGDLSGTWSFVDLCATDGVYGQVKDICAPAQISGETSAISGTLRVNGTTFSRDLQGTFSAQMSIPMICAALAGSCRRIEEVIELTFVDTAVSCADDATGGCACDASTTLHRTTTASIATAGGVATVTSSTGEVSRYAYCVEGDRLQYRGLRGNDDQDIVYRLDR